MFLNRLPAPVITRLVGWWQQWEHFIFGVWEQVSGENVGEAYLANADWHVPRLELGYFILQEHTGKGYTTEAARALVNFAFQQLEVERLELQCQADNLASQKVAGRCGFTFEGRLRQHHRKKDGRLVDVLWYGLLRSEWHNQT